MNVKKIVIKIPDGKYLIGGAILLILLSVCAFNFVLISNTNRANARIKAAQQASINAANAAKSKEAITTTTPSTSTLPPQTQTNIPAKTSAPQKSAFDCVGFNNSQRNLYVQAADLLYSVYQSQKSSNQITYKDYIDEQTKQQAITAANQLAYYSYQGKMDANNGKYFNGLAINNCSNYYQKIPYQAE